MSYDDSFVGVLAIILAIASTAVSVGPWDSPYQLRTIASVKRRFGKSVARIVWLVVAVASLTAGMAILSGVRPPYATPAQSSETDS